MENEKIKCTSKEHEKIDAINFCQECKIYMCNKCEGYHSILFKNHHNYSINSDIKEIFTGFCKENGHSEKLKYFCKDHNILCCSSCLCKIKNKGDGQHSDCNVCIIEDIKEEKKSKLKENIITLENLSNTFNQSINELKIIFEKININKEKLKQKIQKVFTKIRTTINEREDKLLIEVDELFEKLFFKEEIIKESEKLPNKIKVCLEKCKKIENKWNNNDETNSFINDCINIENNINAINFINKHLKNINNTNNLEINFIPEEDNEINELLEIIKTFGKLYENNKIFKFKKCPKNTDEDKKYEIIGKRENIVTKNSKDCNFICAICDYKLEKNKVYKWKIKILKTTNYDIEIGVTNIDFDINLSSPSKYGWYYYCIDSSLYSGPPHNFRGKSTELKKKKNEIIVIMDMNKGSLKFIVDNEDKGESYTNIPINNSLAPSILLYNINDSVEIMEC